MERHYYSIRGKKAKYLSSRGLCETTFIIKDVIWDTLIGYRVISENGVGYDMTEFRILQNQNSFAQKSK